mgnify:CR=1 FL=1
MKQEEIFKRLKDIREKNDLKQKDMALILAVSRPNYTRWETKEKIIPLMRLNDFCNYFKINMDYVIGLSNKPITINKKITLDKKAIGKNIKNFRITNKITQEELASKLGTTHSVISAYENGHTLILTAFLINLCTTYNLSADNLCNRKND